MPLFARLPVFMFARRLVPRTHKMWVSVSATAAPALGRPPALTSFGEIKKLLTAVRIKHHRAHGNFQYSVFARSAVTIRAFAVTSALRQKFAIVAITQQRIVMRIRFDINIAAMPAISTGRATSRDVLLPAKRDAAIAAATGFYRNLSFICKHESPVARDAARAYADAGSINKNTRSGVLERVRREWRLICWRRSYFYLSLPRIRFVHGEYADVAPVAALILKQDDAIDQRKQTVIFRQRNIFSRLVVRAALANQNAAASYELAAKSLNAEPLSVRVASISG